MASEDCGGIAVALEDGGSASVLGGSVGRQSRIAVAALGSGGGRSTCNYGIGVSVVKGKGLLLQPWHQHWQGRQERMCLMQGMYIGSNSKKIGIFWWQWQWRRWGYDDSIDKARARRGWRRSSTGKARAV
jgi:hypothetical protein